jgi:hypothetical protein
MSDLLSLISRLEAAKEGSRELDQEIWFNHVWEGQGDERDVPAYTSSVDAALSLVPEGWSFYRLDQYSNGPDPIWGWGAQLRCHANPEVGLAIGETRASMPLALCIASLRARATT